MVAEQGGEDRRDDDRDAVQIAGMKIWERDDSRRRMEEGHARLTVKASFFYAYNGMYASTDPGWIQLAFDMLTGKFNWVGLRKNVRKTMGMVCRPCRAAWVRGDEAYTRQMTGKVRIFK